MPSRYCSGCWYNLPLTGFEGFFLCSLENALSAEVGSFHPPLHRKQVKQEGALGLLKNLKQDGYALSCCSYPKSDLVLQLQEEDDVSHCCFFFLILPASAMDESSVGGRRAYEG